MRAPLSAIFAAFACLLATACATGTPPSGLRLVGTEWRLDHFESSDDAIGRIRPGADEVYTLLLQPDGNAVMQLFCNRGTGTWTSPDPEANLGSLEITPGAMTMAACPPTRLERLPADLARVRSFVIADGFLHLNLMMDSGNYVWAPTR